MKARYLVKDVITLFAREGVTIDAMSRALELPPGRIERICSRAIELGRLGCMPPQDRRDLQGAFRTELETCRADLANAKEALAQLTKAIQERANQLLGFAGLTRSEATIVSILISRERVSKESIFTILYSSDNCPPTDNVREFVYRARQKLRPHGVKIETITGYGYRMFPEHKAKLSRLALPEIESPSLAPV